LAQAVVNGLCHHGCEFAVAVVVLLFACHGDF